LGIDYLIEFDYVWMPQFLHNGYLVVERLLQVTIAADELLLHPLYGNLAPLSVGCFVDFAEGSLTETVPLVYRIVFYLLY
jgi:hypothetical protein